MSDLEGLRERVAKRDAEAGWVRIERSVLPDPPGRNHPYAGRVYASPDMLTVPGLRLRYVAADADYAPYTAGELAREWLSSILERASRPRLCVGELWTATAARPALFFDPPADRGGEWVMVDVKAAYWTLYSRLAFDCRFAVREGDVCYEPGTLTVPVEDAWVGTEKPLRNAAWGVMLGGPISFYEAGQLKSKPNRGSVYRAPGLTQAVLTQMNALAAEARELGAVMWLTDAAICRPGADAVAISHLLDRWRLEWALKGRGPGYLYALGDYRIGDLETAGGHAEGGGHDTLLPLTAAMRERLRVLG